MLAGKFITLGVTGGIAAYKAAELASTMTKAGAQVHTIMTRSAMEFVQPLTFQALTGNQVHSDIFTYTASFKIPHIDLASHAHLIVVAPATANILGKVAHGIADDLLSTSILAATCPVLFCPAMNVNMYRNQAVQANIQRLSELGYFYVEPGVGRMACGQTGQGRLADTGTIMESIVQLVPPSGDLSGLTVLITAGGTREPIDPVRYISNHSSGKMGYSIADAAVRRGADVILVTTPTALVAPIGAKVQRVQSAREMHEAVMQHFPAVDVVIKAAAVADYRPKVMAEQKIKKEGDTLTLELEKNPDILLELGKRKQRHQTLVGFAAETQSLEENARAKLQKKNLDLVVANDVTQPGAGFGTDTNIAKLLFADGRVVPLPQMEKLKMANRILDTVLEIRSK